LNNIKTLQEILNIVYLADKEITQGTPLYKVKALFDNLNLNGFIEFSTNYGELIQLILDTKRKDVASINIIRARSILESTIEALKAKDLKLAEIEKKGDDLAIDSTCITVTSNEIQLQLNDMPKKLGRPKLVNALSGAARAKRARDKKKEDKRVTINFTLSRDATRLYKLMEKGGYDLNDIVANAFNQIPVPRE
jgi:hypothetical protein